MNMLKPFEIVSFDQNTPDVVIKTSDGELYAHKSVLTAKSETFRKMFESVNEESHATIRINRVSTKVVEDLLQCLYTNRIAHFINKSNCKDLLRMADIYKFVEIKNVCAKYYCTQLTEGNAIEYLKLGEEAHSKILFDACVAFLGPLFSDVDRHDDIVFDQETSDVVIKAPNCEIFAHKAILMARSPVFKAMFENTSDTIVHINDFTGYVIRMLIAWFYRRNTFDLNTYPMHREVLLIADKYQCKSLCDVCAVCMVQQLDNNNVIEYLQLGEKIHFQPLIDACVEYISDNFVKVNRHEQLISLVEPQTVEAILTMQCKNIEALFKQRNERKRKYDELAPSV